MGKRPPKGMELLFPEEGGGRGGCRSTQGPDTCLSCYISGPAVLGGPLGWRQGCGSWPYSCQALGFQEVGGRQDTRRVCKDPQPWGSLAMPQNPPTVTSSA